MSTEKTWNLKDPTDFREYVRWMACAALTALNKRNPERYAEFWRAMKNGEGGFTGRLVVDKDGEATHAKVIVTPAEFASDFSKMSADELTPEIETERRRMSACMPVWFVPAQN